MSHNDDPEPQASKWPFEEKGDDWLKRSPERKWLIHSWLPAGRVTMLTGPGKVGKSRLALQLAAAIAAGTSDWLPGGGPKLILDEPAGAVLATWEDEYDEVARRLHEMKMHTEVENRLRHVAPSAPLWNSSADDPFSRVTEQREKLREYCEDKKARLLVVDPRAAAYGSNENDRAMVRAFMTDWDRWAQKKACAVLLITHPPKSEGPYSGTTDWYAAARAVWELAARTVDPGGKKSNKKDGDRRAVQFACLDTNYAPTPPPLWLTGYPQWKVVKSPEDTVHALAVKRAGDGAAEDTSTSPEEGSSQGSFAEIPP